MRAGILIYNPKMQSILLIHRFKEDRDYYVIPGGGQNPSETALETAQREIAEEIGWQVKQEEMSPAFTIHNQSREEVYFLYKTDRTDTPTIQGEEKERENRNNRYLPCWVSIHELSHLNLQPQKLLEKITSLDLKLDGF